jgi:post-segregation antitoxin (ccd killing protein)
VQQLLGERRKTVSFNLNTERELYELASTINFSAFVKRHLSAEWKRRQGSKSDITVQLTEGGRNA